MSVGNFGGRGLSVRSILKKAKWLVCLLLIVISNFVVMKWAPSFVNGAIAIDLSVESNKADTYELYFTNQFYDYEHRFASEAIEANKLDHAIFRVDRGYNFWRIDFGDNDAEIKIFDISLTAGNYTKSISKDSILNCTESNSIKSIEDKGDYLLITTEGEDPHLMVNMDSVAKDSFIGEAAKSSVVIYKILACIAIDSVLIGLCYNARTYYDYAKGVHKNRHLIGRLAVNDFKTKYVGSYLGIVWAFIQPIVTVLVYWFVFQVGLRSGDVGDTPFVLWLIVGLIPWFFFSDSLGGGSGSLVEYQFLVKKIVFQIDTLPIVKLISSFFVHIAFVVFTIGLYACYGMFPNFYYLQIIYYIICNGIFVLGLCYLTSSLVVFFRDTTQIIIIFLQVGIWMTPILWQISILSNVKLLTIFKLMPMFYIVDGFRDAMLNKVWFFTGEKFYISVFFWFITFWMFTIGFKTFNRLKIHFADVL